MKIEINEDSIKLIAESSFEIEALQKIRTKGVENIRFEDDWNFTGPLVLTHITHPWDTNQSGGR